MLGAPPPRAQRSRAKFLLLALDRRSRSGPRCSASPSGCCATSRACEDIGNLLAGKVLGIILLAFLSILLLSNIITALSTFFLAKDLDLLVAAPVGWFRFYLAKLGETVVHSSWMVALLALPILTAYGIVLLAAGRSSRSSRSPRSCRFCCSRRWPGRS